MDDKEIYGIKRSLMKLECMIMDIYDATITKNRVCPICRNEIRLYVPFGETLRPNAQCPVCRSMERHRSLFLYFKNETTLFSSKLDRKVLHFAPEWCFRDKFRECIGMDYYPVDINPDFPGIRDVVDITDIPYEDAYFDVIICSHVIEHIANEQKALSELYRVLKDDGVAYINVPISDALEVTLEKEQYNTPELRSQYYGQFDHVRLYGNDYPNRLEHYGGWKVDVIDYNSSFTDAETRMYGLSKNEKIYKCTK